MSTQLSIILFSISVQRCISAISSAVYAYGVGIVLTAAAGKKEGDDDAGGVC
jgi:hypothetical protein